MKVFISVDMEGVAGVVIPKQTMSGEKAYPKAAELMVGETNAAIEGAFDAGASEVVVNDAHGGMTNLLPADIDDRAMLVSGPIKPYHMMQGIDDSFAAAMFVGYHSKAKTHGVLGHTFVGSVVAELKINRRAVGETALNAGIAGYHSVPVVMLSGDSLVCAEAEQFIPGIETAAVKFPVSGYAAKNLSPKVAKEKIKQSATKALQQIDQINPFKFDNPVTFELTFARAVMVSEAESIPGVKRVDDMTLAYTANDYMEGFGCFAAMVTMGAMTTRM